AAFAWRFNRRFVLKTIHERLAIAATTTPPMPYRLLKLAEPRW
ncbi:MAG TPA: IS1595 family transposase, partial [Terriglobia bacterium]